MGTPLMCASLLLSRVQCSHQKIRCHPERGLAVHGQTQSKDLHWLPGRISDSQYVAVLFYAGMVRPVPCSRAVFFLFWSILLEKFALSHTKPQKPRYTLPKSCAALSHFC